MRGQSVFDWRGTPSVFMDDTYFCRKSSAPKAPPPPITFSKPKNRTTKLIHELRPKAGR